MTGILLSNTCHEETTHTDIQVQQYQRMDKEMLPSYKQWLNLQII